MSRMLCSLSFLLTVILCSARAAAFVGSSHTANRPQSRPSLTQQDMLPPVDSLVSSSSTILSTIDADIAKLSDNEFAPIFMGGIIVMFGGVISALIVGFILENGNLYASVVADSYAQTEEDEEFWKGLSDEEKKKAQAMIDKLNAKKAQEDGTTTTPQVIPAAPSMMEVVVENDTSEDKVTQELDMFSDYADSAGKK